VPGQTVTLMKDSASRIQIEMLSRYRYRCPLLYYPPRFDCGLTAVSAFPLGITGWAFKSQNN